jgi:hypothetical protein
VNLTKGARGEIVGFFWGGTSTGAVIFSPNNPAVLWRLWTVAWLKLSIFE